MGDITSLIYKNDLITASYYRKIHEVPATAFSPPTQLAMATELRYHMKSRQSEWALGIHHQRVSYQYSASITSEPAVSVSLEQAIGGGGIRLGLSGEMRFEGPGESKFGILLSLG